MVRHVILWKLKSDLPNVEAVKRGIKSALEGLQGVVPGLLSIAVQTECLASSNVDVMLDSTFESEAALKGYAVHPAHLSAADNFVRPFTAQRSCLDFIC